MDPSRPPVPPTASRADVPTFDAGFAKVHPARLLVADDNSINLRMMVQMLGKLGYSAETANNGREVLAKVNSSFYDVVLMDVEMPELDGVSATRAIRKEIAPEQQPAIIAVTAHALAEAKRRFLDAKMDDVLTKPILVPELAAILARVIDLRKKDSK